MTLFVCKNAPNPQPYTLDDIFTPDVVVSLNRVFKSDPEELLQQSIDRKDLLKIVRAQEKLFTYLAFSCFEVQQLRDIRHRLYDLSVDLEDSDNFTVNR